MRAQVNFNRIFGKTCYICAGGAERRLVRRTGAQNYYMDMMIIAWGVKPINPLAMSPLLMVLKLCWGRLIGSMVNIMHHLTHTEDRYVSFYANGSYTFDERYSLTGSIRIDQSNLFGTDPKYQYRPLWSVGGSWQIANESLWKIVCG